MPRRARCHKMIIPVLVLLVAPVAGGAKKNPVEGSGAAWSPVKTLADPRLPFRIQTRTHRNGLTLVVAKMNTPGVLGYGTLMRVGARHEVEPGMTGFAHFFEHIMFKGTPKYPPVRYKAALQSLGADDNAYTNKDGTFYFLVTRADALDQVVEMEADRFQNLRYPKPTFQTEARAVLGEYRKSMANPWYKAWEVLHRTAFGRHTYGHLTIGLEKDIRAMPSRYDYSLGFFKRYYRPDSTIVIAAGDVSIARLSALAQKHYGAWSGKSAQPNVVAEPEQSLPRRAHVRWTSKTLPRLVIGYKTPAFLARPRDSAALAVAGELIFGKASRLYRELVLEKQLVGDLDGGPDPSRDPYLFLVTAELKKREQASAVLEAIAAALKKVAGGGVGKTPVVEARAHLRYTLTMQLNTPKAVLFHLARMVSARGNPQDVVTYARELDRVEVADVVRVVRSYLTPARSTTVTLWHGPAPTGGGR